MRSVMALRTGVRRTARAHLRRVGERVGTTEPVRLIRGCLARQSISLGCRIGLFMAHRYHPAVIHSCGPGRPVEAVPMRYIPTRQLWINLWKLWIAIGNYWCCPAARGRPASSPERCPIASLFRGSGGAPHSGPHTGARIAVGAVPDRPAPRRPLPRPASSPRLGWSGDPGVLPVRHSVERARAAPRPVPTLPRGADGATAGHASGRPTVERAGWPGVGQAARGPCVAAHPAAASAGLPVDSGAPRRRAGSATWTTVPGAHAALRGDTALGFGGPR
jgi:hypothetical protein